MSYGADRHELFLTSASLSPTEVFKGAETSRSAGRAADAFIISSVNAKTAKTMGLEIPTHTYRPRRQGHRVTLMGVPATGPSPDIPLVAPHMSPFRGKADMTILRASVLLRSLLGESGHGLLQRIYLLLTQSGHPDRFQNTGADWYDALPLSLGGSDIEARDPSHYSEARLHGRTPRRRSRHATHRCILSARL